MDPGWFDSLVEGFESPRLLLAALVAVVALPALYLLGSVGAGRRLAFLREAAIVAGAFFTYMLVRSATEGEVAAALAHADSLVSLERSYGLFIEPAVQAAIIGERWLVDAANLVYVWGHWPVIGVVALWLYRTQPQRYRLLRNAFLISGAIGLLLFMTFPTAPPRLVDLRLVDTVVVHSDSYRVLQPPALTNQYAAFPSLHFGWNLLIGIALIRGSPRITVQMFGMLLPVAMLAAVVVTANHYWVDAAAGAMVALAGLALAMWIGGERSAPRRTASA